MKAAIDGLPEDHQRTTARPNLRNVDGAAGLEWAMDPAAESRLTVTEIVRDSAAMNEAVLAGDYDEARFRAQLIVAKADASGH